MKTYLYIKIMGIIVILLLPASIFADVDVNFSFQTDQWQQNGVYEVSVVLHNNDTQAVNLAAVQVDFNYESPRYKGVGDTAVVVTHDYLTGYSFTVETVDVSNDGYVRYQKGITSTGSPNYFTVGGDSDFTLATFRFRVAGDAELSDTDFIFRFGVEVLKRLANDDTESVLGEYPAGTVAIVVDTTPPNTYADPGGSTRKFGDATNIRLAETAVPAYDDLTEIFYKVGTPTVADPTGSSPSGSDGVIVELPVNSEGEPGPIAVQLKYFGRDGHGNDETPVNLEDYTVDIIRPTISNQSRSPERVKLGEDVTVNFSVNEDLSGDPVVTINGRNLVKISGGPDYTYVYTAQEGDTEGTRPIVITVADTVGNQRVDGSLSVVVDFTPPGYIPVEMTPRPAQPNDTLTIIFDATEPLDTANTEVSIDGNAAVFQESSGLRYTYQYSVIGMEESSFVKVHGYDLAGNHSWNYQGWEDIEVSADDQYGNPGTGEGTVGIILQRYSD